jgi:hypothetical protein
MPKQKTRRFDNVDATSLDVDDLFVIPTLADILIMYSTSEGFYSFRNEYFGSWFIQSLIKELEENIHDDLMTILTAVNRRVAYAYQSNTTKKEWDACKQMPNMVSMLTKILYFTAKS